MTRPRLAHRIIITGRKIDLSRKTDVAATFRRIRREQEATREKNATVTPIKKRKAA